MTAKPLKASEIVEEFGFSTRYWIKLAAAGKIPGAKQPAGPRGCWVFEQTAFRRWWSSRGRQVTQWQGYTGAERPGGAVFSERAASIGNPSKRDLKASLAAVLRNGSTA